MNKDSIDLMKKSLENVDIILEELENKETISLIDIRKYYQMMYKCYNKEENSTSDYNELLQNCYYNILESAQYYIKIPCRDNSKETEEKHFESFRNELIYKMKVFKIKVECFLAYIEIGENYVQGKRV